jgi:hypothetical protein
MSYTISWQGLWDEASLDTQRHIFNYLRPLDLMTIRSVSRRGKICIDTYSTIISYRHIKINPYNILTQNNLNQNHGTTSKILGNISVGVDHIIVVNHKKNMMCRGNNNYGQLGNKTRNMTHTNKSFTVRMPHVSSTSVRKVAAGNIYIYISIIYLSIYLSYMWYIYTYIYHI